MEPALRNFEPLIFAGTGNAIDQPVGMIDSSRPPALKFTFQRLGLTCSLERMAAALLNQFVESRKRGAVTGDPVLIVVPRLIGEYDPHGTTSACSEPSS